MGSCSRIDWLQNFETGVGTFFNKLGKTVINKLPRGLGLRRMGHRRKYCLAHIADYLTKTFPEAEVLGRETILEKFKLQLELLDTDVWCARRGDSVDLAIGHGIAQWLLTSLTETYSMKLKIPDALPRISGQKFLPVTDTADVVQNPFDEFSFNPDLPENSRFLAVSKSRALAQKKSKKSQNKTGGSGGKWCFDLARLCRRTINVPVSFVNPTRCIDINYKDNLLEIQFGQNDQDDALFINMNHCKGAFKAIRLICDALGQGDTFVISRDPVPSLSVLLAVATKCGMERKLQICLLKASSILKRTSAGHGHHRNSSADGAIEFLSKLSLQDSDSDSVCVI